MSTTGDNNNQCSDSSGEITSNKEECTSCEQNNVNNITEGINGVAILEDMSTCASCGKEGNSSDMNTCNKCKMVKYCNATCKKKHRTKHKKKCDRRVAELHDEKLFADPPPPEECPICFIILPDVNQTQFQSCCGKLLCVGCVYAMKMSEGKDICAFCRTPPASSDEEHVKRVYKLIDNANSFNYLAGLYGQGLRGLPQDYQKAHKLFLKAGELGCAEAYHNLGLVYYHGLGVDADEKKAKHYYKLAVIMGDIDARHNLACIEGAAGNEQHAMKHFIIAARAGYKESLDRVKMGFMVSLITKDEYASTLRAHHERQKEMKSDERDKAAASTGIIMQ